MNNKISQSGDRKFCLNVIIVGLLTLAFLRIIPVCESVNYKKTLTKEYRENTNSNSTQISN